MKTILVVVLFVILASCSCNALEGASATIPLLAWSNAKIFSTQNQQYLATITDEDIEKSICSLLGVESEKGFITTSGTPEVVVLFVEPQLQTDQIPHFGAAYATSNDDGSFSALKRLVHTSQSSLVAPYATSGISFSLLDTLLERVAKKAPIVLVHEEGSTLFHELSKNENVRTSSIDNLKGAELYANGKTELIVVCLTKAENEKELAAHDHIIDVVTTLVSVATSGNFVGMYTGNSASSNLLWKFPNPNAAFFAQSQFGSFDLPLFNNNTNTTQLDTYFTGPMLEAFMVCIALVVMVLVGVCNICNLQVPEQYENPKQQKQM